MRPRQQPPLNTAYRLFLRVAAVALLVFATAQAGRVQTPTDFAARIGELSEPGGYFDTDNLISNEKSYLHVVPALRRSGLAGGAYIGVGPDQNFSYIAQLRPSVAFIIDIRRDNLLLQLLFKGLFQLSGTRVEYLGLLVGRPVPSNLEPWRRADVDRIVNYIDDAPSPTPEEVRALRARVDTAIRAFGVPLSEGDVATIDRFHRTFISRGLPLKFETTGRAARPYYPTLRELLLETDREGRRWSYLASEDDFQFVRALEQRDLVIPVVGNLAGPHALVEIGKRMRARGDKLSAFYTSNVEDYLFRDGTFPKFVDNVSRLPRTGRSVIIRSVFSGGPGSLPYSVPGYASASLVQPVDDLLKGQFGSYRQLVR